METTQEIAPPLRHRSLLKGFLAGAIGGLVGAAAKAAGDAMSLATAIHRAGRNVDAALAGWQASQIERGQELLQYGVALGQRWAKAR